MGNSTTPEIDPTVQECAEQAGRAAVARFYARHRAEMRAHENDTAARQAGTATPPRWLTDDPCPAWCCADLDHDAATHPADRVHYGPTHSVELVTEDPTVVGYPDQWAQPELNIGLERRYREREPRVFVGVGDDMSVYATLAEAEQIAAKLVDLVRQARGWTSPSTALFGADGRCPDVACRHCYPVAGEVTA